MPSHKHVLSWAVLILLVCTSASGATVASVPRLEQGTWVMDTTGTLHPDTIAKINNFGKYSVNAGQRQIAVAVVDSTGRIAPSTFAARLFNRWAMKKDGVLLLISRNGQKAAVVLGRGVKTSVKSKDTREVVTQLAPLLRDARLDDAAIEGTQRLSQLLHLNGTVLLEASPPPPRPRESQAGWFGLRVILILASINAVVFGALRYFVPWEPSASGRSDGDDFRGGSSGGYSSNDGGHASASSYSGGGGSSGSGGGY